MDAPRAADASASSASSWGTLDHSHLRRLIADQIPRFRARPYLADVASIKAFFTARLESVLEDDYCWSLCFDANFFRALCFEGFLPICTELGGGTGLFVLLPKLHADRSILRFDALHVPKKLRRRALREAYTLSIDDGAFDAVLAGCVRQHGEAAWLHPPLRSTLAAIRVEQARASCDQPDSVASGIGGVRLFCFALWRGDELVAGEIGVVCGRVYTSFSGFYAADGAGAVQMALTGRLLERAHIAWWDMGQEHEYKRALGAVSVPRQHFLDAFREQRHRANAIMELVANREGSTRFGAAELLATADSPHSHRPSCIASAASAAGVAATPATLGIF